MWSIYATAFSDNCIIFHITDPGSFMFQKVRPQQGTKDSPLARNCHNCIGSYQNFYPDISWSVAGQLDAAVLLQLIHFCGLDDSKQITRYSACWICFYYNGRYSCVCFLHLLSLYLPGYQSVDLIFQHTQLLFPLCNVLLRYFDPLERDIQTAEAGFPILFYICHMCLCSGGSQQSLFRHKLYVFGASL